MTLTKIPLMGQLKQQTFIFSPFWSLKSRIRAGFSLACRQLPAHTAFFLGLSTPNLFLKEHRSYWSRVQLCDLTLPLVTL